LIRQGPVLTGRRKLCFALMSCVLLLLMAEAGLRFLDAFPMPDGLFLQDATDDRHLTDPVLFWRLNPGLTRKASSKVRAFRGTIFAMRSTSEYPMPSARPTNVR